MRIDIDAEVFTALQHGRYLGFKENREAIRSVERATRVHP